MLATLPDGSGIFRCSAGLSKTRCVKAKFNSNALERGNTLTELPVFLGKQDSCCVGSRWSCRRQRVCVSYALAEGRVWGCRSWTPGLPGRMCLQVDPLLLPLLPSLLLLPSSSPPSPSPLLLPPPPPPPPAFLASSRGLPYLLSQTLWESCYWPVTLLLRLSEAPLSTDGWSSGLQGSERGWHPLLASPGPLVPPWLKGKLLFKENFLAV